MSKLPDLDVTHDENFDVPAASQFALLIEFMCFHVFSIISKNNGGQAQASARPWIPPMIRGGNFNGARSSSHCEELRKPPILTTCMDVCWSSWGCVAMQAAIADA